MGYVMEEREMRTVLWDDAVRMHACESEHLDICHRIAQTAYRRFMLTEAEFHQLVLMNLNRVSHLTSMLMPNGEPRTIGAVTSRLVQLFPADRPIEVFRLATEQIGWFEQCFVLCARFDRRIMGELHIRPLMDYESIGQPVDAGYYLEDGAHRALAYAMRLELGIEAFEPVPVVFSEDWSHIYPWGVKR